MIDQNCVYASVLFHLICKIVCFSTRLYFYSMYNKRKPTLTSIPEKNEVEEEELGTKWVPKKKHEVLKAKYKCLKKLFQIYDASVIGILPDPYAGNGDGYSIQGREEEVRKSRRKKRSHRTKTDASAGTNDISSGDVTLPEESDKITATAVIRDLQIDCSNTITALQSDCKSKTTISKFKAHEYRDCFSNSISERECECTQTTDALPQHLLPCLLVNEKRKPTRFQSFIQRLLGIRRERPGVVLPNGHVLAASDNSIGHRYLERRKRRGLRFRRVHRPNKIQSEGALHEGRCPSILTYVQSVQRSCLLDTTPRQCPIVGCRMIFYGIINYNDHLNLCHFTERKFACHYCHAGFEREADKLAHEDGHIGINKINASCTSPPSTSRKLAATTCDTQTDAELTVQEEKLKKIVSFFDKIVDSDQILTEMKKTRCSESNLLVKTECSDNETVDEILTCNSGSKRTTSCANLYTKGSQKGDKSSESEVTSTFPYQHSIKCNFCGEQFDYRRQLSLHVDLEHRVHGKFSKFHSCAGIVNCRPQCADLITEDGRINVQSIDQSRTVLHEAVSSTTNESTSRTLSCYPSTNIVYSSTDVISKKSSVLNSIADKFRGIGSYKWEPGTKIIRV